MTEILCYMPTYSPDVDASPAAARPYTIMKNKRIAERLNKEHRVKPWVYMDAIDSVLNNPTTVDPVVADGRSTDSIREELTRHWQAAGGYSLELYSDKMSQWTIFNDILEKHATKDTKYFVYTSSDVVWTMDWVAEAIKEFKRNPRLMVIFPTVSRGDKNLPCQVAEGPCDEELIDPPYQKAARAPVLNAYAMIFRMDFLKEYGGYPTAFRNCFTESFLYYMCEAKGWYMRVMPRGWVYHHSALDAWGGMQPDGTKSYYFYNQEKGVFTEIMDRVIAARDEGKMTADLLRSELYRKS